MKPIKIHIDRLGLVRDADITITPMMVFSGESGIGKSYVAILCHYFFYVWLSPKRLDTFFKELQKEQGLNFYNQNQNFPDKGIALTITKKDLQNWLSKDAVTYISYMLGHNGFSADIKVQLPDVFPDKIAFQFEQELMGIDNAEDIYYKLTVLHISYRFKQELGFKDESPYAYVFRYAAISEIFGDFHKLDYDFVLPPSRGSYLSEDVRAKTGLYTSFVEGMEELEQAKEITDNVNTHLSDLLKTIIDGEVKKSGDNYVYITHNDTMPASAAASSVREIAPLQLMIMKRDISKASVLIEEPEAHLHPLKQRLMADIIATMALGGANMQITTHSDYFLRRINDLLRLNLLKSKKSEEEYNKICKKYRFNPDLTINPSILSAYYLEKKTDEFVTIKLQDIKEGIPFDTFTKINGKPMADSALIYELTTGQLL
ncbi:MAG: AAA family ATPase [Salinivirgaceae bacterium]|nr:AAA family ATPase [Salinivirgaceae bacterium]